MKKSDFSSLNRELTIGQVAKRCGVAISALHFYEQKGLISSYRNQGNQRRFGRDVLRKVAIIKAAQQLGIPLASVKSAFNALPPDRAAGQDNWKNLSQIWRKDLDERIKRLTLLRDQLSHCIGCGCLSLKDCPLRNPDDTLSKEGAGARLLE